MRMTATDHAHDPNVATGELAIASSARAQDRHDSQQHALCTRQTRHAQTGASGQAPHDDMTNLDVVPLFFDADMHTYAAHGGREAQPGAP